MNAALGVDWFSPQPGKLLLGSQYHALAIDHQTEEITAIIEGYGLGSIPFKAPRNLKFGTYIGSRIMLPLGSTLIYREARSPTAASLYAMSAGDAKPVSILEKCFPDQPDRHLIHELAESRQGMLLL